MHDPAPPAAVSPSHAAARTRVASGALPRPKFRYSPVVRAGGFAFVSGLVALDPHTGALVEGGPYEQSRRILDNLLALCAEQGWTLEQLVVARIYCTDLARFAEINRAWDACFEHVAPPARTSVGVSALPLGALVEMEFQFVVA